MKKIPAAFSGNDAALYREALDGIEPAFPQLVSPPGITSMVLRVLWSRASALCSFPPIAFVSSAHHNILALYVGSYRPGYSSRGVYLVYDALENSDCGMGSGVVVLNCSNNSNQYLLAELLLRKEDDGLASNKATLFRWRSWEADRWAHTEVVLPFPSETDEDTSAEVTYTF